jgi:hypothetical protein
MMISAIDFCSILKGGKLLFITITYALNLVVNVAYIYDLKLSKSKFVYLEKY